MTELPRHIVGAAVIALCTAMIAALFFVEIPEGNRDIAMVLLGMVLAVMWTLWSVNQTREQREQRKGLNPYGNPASATNRTNQ